MYSSLLFLSSVVYYWYDFTVNIATSVWIRKKDNLNMMAKFDVTSCVYYLEWTICIIDQILI